MCLIVFAYQPHQQYPFTMAANRDEFYARPTQAMHRWPESGVLAGKDLEQQGTWLGFSQDGKFAAVTNYRDGKAPASALLSRGHLTRDFLTSSDEANHYIQQLQAHKHRYGGFNLLVGDRNGLFYLSNRQGQIQTLKPGIYGLSNALLDTPWPKLSFAKHQLQAALNIGTYAALRTVLSCTQQANDHTLPNTGISLDLERQLSSCFIQLPHYGTRAMTIVRQEQSGLTEIEEHNFGPDGRLDIQKFTRILPPLGSHVRECRQ